MDADFHADWERLGKLAFRRHEKTGRVFKRLYKLLGARRQSADRQWLLIVKNWLLVPLTLWPVDFIGLAAHLCKTVESGKRLDQDFLFILEEIENLPAEKSQMAIAEYERLVQQGQYEPLIRAKSKYAIQEEELLNNRKLRNEWKRLKCLYQVEKFRDRKGIVRRRMAQERNFRPDWAFKWGRKKDRFQVAFDTFCHRWNLYGMEGDKPLLLKLSVNPTAHGLMIVIPTYWSLDVRRDVDWRAINKLHKARGALRQGPKMSEGRLQRHKQAHLAYHADRDARKKKLRGDDRWEFIAKQASLPLKTEARIIRRLVTEGSRL